MSEKFTVICSRCGEENEASRYFCKKCGMGLELIIPHGSVSPQDVDIGALLKSGFIGGLFGGIISFLFIAILQVLARKIPETLSPAKTPFFFYISIQISAPFFFSLFSSIWIFIKARSMGLKGSWIKTFFGSLLAVAIAISCWSVSKIIGILFIAILPPFLGARVGLGLLAPIFSKKKLIVFFTIFVLFISVFHIYTFYRAADKLVLNNSITCINKKSDNLWWAATGNRNLYILTEEGKLKRFSRHPISSETIKKIVSIDTNHFLIINEKRGIVDYNSKSQKLFLSRRKVFDITFWKDIIIAGTENGCFLWDQKNNFSKLPSLPIPKYHNKSIIKNLHFINSNTFIAAVLENGLYAFSFNTKSWKMTTFPDPFPIKIVSLPENKIMISAIGQIYIGNIGLKDWRETSQGLPITFLPDTLTISHAGIAYIAAKDGIYSWNSEKQQWKKQVTLKDKLTIFDIVISTNNKIFVASRKGLFVISPSNSLKINKINLP